MMMAQAFAKLLTKAFDALLYYGINFRILAEYQNQTLLDEAAKLVLHEGRNKYLLWIERVEHGIDAAIRRKQFRNINDTGHPLQ